MGCLLWLVISLISGIVCLAIEADAVRTESLQKISIGRHYFVLPVLLFVMSVVLALVGSLFVYHMYLMKVGRTTNEDLKGVYHSPQPQKTQKDSQMEIVSRKKMNPFDTSSFWANLMSRLTST
jgi:hypothetical protein